jgi:hypothetical protein
MQGVPVGSRLPAMLGSMLTSVVLSCFCAAAAIAQPVQATSEPMTVDEMVFNDYGERQTRFDP